MPEPTSNHPKVSTWLNHIRSLAVDIGPRGPTRKEERQGALYAQAQYERMGFKPAFETFPSARSIFHPHLLASILMLLAFILFPLGGRMTAILSASISIFVLVCELLELSFQDNPFRVIMPKGESQNVYAVIPPAGEHKRDLVLVGHMDSQRTPIIFSTRRWVKIYDRFTMVTFLCFIMQVLIYSLAGFFNIPWAWYASIPAAVCAVLLASMCIQADATPFTAGANDNASAVGMVLTLLKSMPLNHFNIHACSRFAPAVKRFSIMA